MFKTSKISFCSNQACNVVEDSFKEEILNILQKNYYVSIKDKNFYIVNSKNIKYIEKNPHFLSVKSSGSLYYLFLTKIENKNLCFFIDKKIKEGHNYPRIISVNYRFSDELFNNTLFNGELLRDKDENWLYIINNLVLLKGEIMKNKHINYKLNQVYDILSNYYQKDEHLEICPLYVKRLFANHEFNYLINNYIPNLNYNCRGIYFEGIRDLKNHLFLIPRGHKFTPNKNVNSPSVNSSSVNKSNVNSPSVNKSNVNSSSVNSSSVNKSNVNSQSVNKSNVNKSNVNKSNVNKKEQKKNVDISNRENMVFMVRKTEISDIYNLYCIKDNDIYKYGGAHISNLRTSKYMRKCFTEGDNLNMNCEYNKNMGKWTPKQITTEKVDNLSSIESFLCIN